MLKRDDPVGLIAVEHQALKLVSSTALAVYVPWSLGRHAGTNKPFRVTVSFSGDISSVIAYSKKLDVTDVFTPYAKELAQSSQASSVRFWPLPLPPASISNDGNFYNQSPITSLIL